MLSVVAQSGGGPGNWTPLIKVLIFALFVGFSGLSWIFKKLNEQAAIKRKKEAIERSQSEALRTGRANMPAGGSPGSTPVMPTQGSTDAEADARRRLQELAARRRAELQRLARQQGQGSGPAQPQRPTEPARRTVPPVTAPRPVQVAGAGQGRPARTGRSQQRPAPRQREQAPVEPQWVAQAQRRADPPRRAPESEGESSTHRVVSDAPPLAAMPSEGLHPVLRAEQLRKATISDLRKAYVFSMILKSPVGESQVDGFFDRL